MSDLPEGWSLVSLGELGQWGSGGTPPRKNASYYSGGTIPWLVIGDLTDGYVYKAQTYITENGLNNSSAKLLPKDTILVAMYGSIGKLGITSIECATNQAIAFCRNDASVVTLQYLFYALANAKPALIALGQGGAQQNISQSVLKNFQIPLAPRAEQPRIAQHLVTLLNRINACHQRIDAIPALLKRFRQAVLELALSGDLTIAWRNAVKGEIDAWQSVSLGDIADVGTGSTPLRSNGSYFANSGTPWITSAATGSPYVTDAKEYVTPAAISSHRMKVYAPGALLIAMYGEGKTRGQVTELRIHATINQACAAVRVNQSQASTAFVKLALWSQYEQMRALAEGGNQPNLNLSKVKGIPIQLPPLHEQAEIVQKVEALFKLADRVEARYTEANSQAQRLPSLVLAKAFRGELLPQDPSDEPASDLLARIAAQRKSATPAPKTRQPRASRAAHALKESAAMTKSRQDEDVKGKPYLADHLRRLGEPVAVQALYQVAELPVADFYKQLAWEVEQGHVRDNTTSLELGHAAG